MSKIYKIGNVGFVHMNKTGGTSVRVFAEKHLSDELHSVEIPDTVGHVTPMRTRHYFNDPLLTTMVFVRHPLDWIKSTWRYWTKYPNIRPDAMRALGNPFCYWGTTFSQRLLDMIHEGDFEKTMVYWYHHDRYFLLDLYSAFTSDADFIGNVESLSFHLFTFLRTVNNKDYDEEKEIFNEMEWQNKTFYDFDNKDLECNENLLKEFYNINFPLFERFNYD